MVKKLALRQDFSPFSSIFPCTIPQARQHRIHSCAMWGTDNGPVPPHSNNNDSKLKDEFSCWCTTLARPNRATSGRQTAGHIGVPLLVTPECTRCTDSVTTTVVAQVNYDNRSFGAMGSTLGDVLPASAQRKKQCVGGTACIV